MCIGYTTAGKPVYSSGHYNPIKYKTFSVADHVEAADIHGCIADKLHPRRNLNASIAELEKFQIHRDASLEHHRLSRLE